MGHITAFKKQLHAAIDASGLRADIRAVEKRLERLTRESALAASARAALPPGSSRARVTSANARWARKAEAREQAAEELEALRGKQPATPPTPG